MACGVIYALHACVLDEGKAAEGDFVWLVDSKLSFTNPTNYYMYACVHVFRAGQGVYVGYMCWQCRVWLFLCFKKRSRVHRLQKPHYHY
jgi:hypothetical protein